MRTLKQILEAAGYETQAYSGRGMMRDKCLAIVTDDEAKDVFAAILEVIEPGEASEVARSVRGMCEDSMGRQIVLYWPREEWNEGEEEAA